MIYKQKIEVECAYIPIPDVECATFVIDVPTEFLDNEQDLVDNEKIIELTEEMVLEDFDNLTLIKARKLEDPKEDFEGYQKMLEDKGQQYLTIDKLARVAGNNMLDIVFNVLTTKQGNCNATKS